ncbi:hypothetical protein [Mycolicibacterium goodii]|uniref:hypothetical protein n=1 Tax=Mycolicibacterium goodii TaxID=134601 RepID=UPI001BDD967E|nr:hypothetical protein [Mycolicibacterium goodii]MBU8830866.1 hypothetical protein [Mycolicibacterium goodii]
MTEPVMTLAEAQAWLRDRIDEGETCPCCTQFAKIYRRRLNASMARGIIIFYQTHGVTFGHAPSTPGISELGGEFARLRWWGLIQEALGGRDDGNPHAGWWQITRPGLHFVHNRIAVPEYARVYNGRCLNLDDTTTTTIRQALGKRFNYDELMAGI